MPWSLFPASLLQREITVSEDDLESYQLSSHQLELPVVLVQDSMADLESGDLEPIPRSFLSSSPTFGTERPLQQLL